MADDIVSRLLNTTCAWHDCEAPCQQAIDRVEAAEEIQRLRAVVDALRARPFRGTSKARRVRMYGSDWEAVHDALDALEQPR